MPGERPNPWMERPTRILREDDAVCPSVTAFQNLPSGVNGDIRVDVSGDLGRVHVRGVLEVGLKTMVLADQGVENVGEVYVGVFISSVDTAVLVVEINSAGNGLGQGEARGLGDDVGELVPLLLGHVLGDQRVLGLDVGEWLRHLGSAKDMTST